MGLTEELPSWIRKYLTPNGNELQIKGNTSIGDNNNYTEFKSDGEINLHGTARIYTGLEIQAKDFKEPAANTATLVNIGMGVAYAFSDGDEDRLHSEVRIPKKWMDTEDIDVILIWSSPATSKDCDWEVDYLFRAFDEDMTVTTPDDTLQSYETSSATTSGLVHSKLSIPSADFNSGDKQLIMQVRRDGDDGSDTLADTANLHTMMVRGVTNKLGGNV